MLLNCRYPPPQTEQKKHCSDILVVHLRSTRTSAAKQSDLNFDLLVLSVNPEGVINIDQPGLQSTGPPSSAGDFMVKMGEVWYKAPLVL